MTDPQAKPEVSAAPAANDANVAAVAKKKNSLLDGYALIILGALLFMIGGHFSNSPLLGQHKLLVATSLIGQAELKQSVIFIVRHTRQGTMGIVINHPRDKSGVSLGGPVGKDDPEKFYALHSPDVVVPGDVALQDVGLNFLEGKKSIDLLKGAKTKPAWYVIVHGFAGWSSGQMEQEISDGGWNLSEFDGKVVTGTPPAKLWDAARKLTIVQLTH